MSTSETNLLNSLETVTTRSMRAFEEETIAAYPLDGRHLDMSRNKSKKRRKSSRKPSKIESQSSFKSLVYDRLYPFQQQGVEFLLSKFELNTGALLADEMGLGKSVQIIAFLSTIFPRLSHPVLLICPTTLIAHWQLEFAKWDPSIPISTTEGETANIFVKIVSYDSFRTSPKTSLIWSVVILDEAQRIRNPFAKTTLAVKQTNSHCRIALSGSPIQNNLNELWSIIDFIAPGKLGTLATFEEELARPIEEGTRPNASPFAKQLSLKCALLLRDLTKSCMLRRLKSEQLVDLPAKEEKVLFCQLSPEQVEVYCQFLTTRTVRECIQKKGKKSFYSLSILRRISNHPDLLLAHPTDVDDYGSPARSGKLAVLVALLKVWMREKHRVLVFSQSLGVLDIVQLALNEMGYSWDRMDGQTSLADRTRIMAKWSESEPHTNDVSQILLLSTKVGGVGLNLIGASRVVIFDPDWNPMTDAQARERSWRIGQAREVKIYRLVAAESIEEIICKRQIYKNHLAQKILQDPQQLRHNKFLDWDSDFFRPPKKVHSKPSASVAKICAAFETLDEADVDEQTEEKTDANESMASLIMKVWNQEEIEMPKQCASLVSSREVDAAAQKALAAITNSSQQSASRSSSLLKLISPEKSVAAQIVEFFKNKSSPVSTEDILAHPFNIQDADLFRTCLRQLCEFQDGSWTFIKSFEKKITL